MGKLCRKIWAAWNVVLLFICRLTAAFVGRRGDNILIARSDAIGDFVVFGECLKRFVKQLHPACEEPVLSPASGIEAGAQRVWDGDQPAGDAPPV